MIATANRFVVGRIEEMLALAESQADEASVRELDEALEVGCRVPVCLPALATGQVIRGLCSSASAASVEIWGTAA